MMPFRLRHGAVDDPVQMQGLKTVVGASQIVFGDDYPFGAGPAKHLQGLQKCGFSADELQPFIARMLCGLSRNAEPSYFSSQK